MYVAKVVPMALATNTEAPSPAESPAEVDLKRRKAPLKRDREARLNNIVADFFVFTIEICEICVCFSRILIESLYEKCRRGTHTLYMGPGRATSPAQALLVNQTVGPCLHLKQLRIENPQ